MKGIRNTNQVVVNNNINGTELKILEKLNKLGMLKTNKKRKPRMEAQMAPQMLPVGLAPGMPRMPTPLIREQAPTEALTRASIDEINRQTATNLAAQRQALVDEARAIVQDRFQEPQRFRANVEVESPFTDTEGQGDAIKQGVNEDVDIKEESEQMGQNVGQSESAFKAREEGKPVSAQAFGFAPEEDVWSRLERRYPVEALGARFSGLGIKEEEPSKAREEDKPISAQAFGFAPGIRVATEYVKNDPNEKKLSEMAMKYRPRIQGIGIQSKVTPEPVEKPKPKPKAKAKAKPRQDIVFEEVDEL